MSSLPDTNRSITSGSYKLDRILSGIGGFPRGQIIEIFGPSGSGKSSLVLSCVRNNPKEIPLIVDTEFKFDASYTKGMGIDLRSFLLLQSNILGDIEQFAEVAIAAGSKLVIIDTLAALEHQSKSLGRIMSHISELLTRNVCIILVNQVRWDIGNSKEVSYGGKKVAFFPALRLRIIPGESIEFGNQYEEGYVTGGKINISIVKNSFSESSQPKETELEVLYGQGIPNHIEVLDIAFQLGYITRNGNWYYYNSRRLGSGRLRAAEELASLTIYPSLVERIRRIHGQENVPD